MPKHVEQTIQIALAGYLYNLERVSKLFTFTHPANEGKRSPWQGALLKRCGLRPGEHDLIIFPNLERTDKTRPFFIELKVPPNKLSKDQETRRDLLRSMGYHAYEIRTASVTEALRQLETILRAEGMLQ